MRNILQFMFYFQVLIENKRAVGVEFDYNNFTFRARAKKEIILSAGTVNSAQLLMLSGVGPMSELQKFNVSCSD